MNIAALREDFKVSPDGTLYRVAIKGKPIEPRVTGTLDSSGYLQCTYMNKQHRVHRLVFAIVYGHLPMTVDHIDGDILNNSPLNLRPATHSQQAINTKLKSTNSTGYRGVSWSTSKGKYMAYINVDGKRTWLGNFSSLEDAVKARESASAAKHFGYTRAGGGLSGVM